MEIEIFEVDPSGDPGRFGYRVGGVYQEWHPDFDGFVAMSEAVATAQAQIVAQRMAG